ncbi:MAG: NAD(+)/NADH kinase, partial [Oscillospiraceae bacterium]
DSCDIIVAVGGDGTIFHCAFDALLCDKPILGINAGRLGFLSQMELSDLSPLQYIPSNKFTVEKRMVLEAFIKTSSVDTSFLAINDIVFSRSHLGRIIDLDVKCNDEFVGSYRADGLIFATPTGSTAYSLSAGGPVCDPSMDCIVFTPICAHSVFDRSVLFSGDKEIEVSHKFPDEGDKLIVVVDGQPVLLEETIENITIKMSQKRTQFIVLNGKNFYCTFNKKFK